MATNKEKYQTICNRVVFARGSWALDRFIEDAVAHHMDDQTGKLVALRLTEYYELLDRLNILPGGLAMLSPYPGMESQQGPSAQGNGNVPTSRSGKAVEDDDEDEQSSSVSSSGTGIDDDVLDQWG
ncbi:MAG: hypothetical protein H0U76_00225 [Ktedonobacteraceae bacterium]|nr:hypothetical protein [Ktedonobacteraceae bacterium]